MKIQHRDTFDARLAVTQNDASPKTDDIAVTDAAIIGDSAAAHALRQMALLAASCDSPMLITGPHGSEKLCIARAIHAASNRRDGPFVRIDCGAAKRAKSASEQAWETAHNGTLFLDDADEMSPDVQTQAWQLIANPSARQSLDQNAPPLNIRVIAASSISLAAKVKEGGFRSDLYARLSLMSLPIAPLKQRRVDVEAMIDHFLLAFRPAERFTIDWPARQELRAHNWPGNVSELRGLVARACLFHPGQNIGSHRMRALLAMGHSSQANAKTPSKSDIPTPFGPHFNLKVHLNAEEARYIRSALQQADGIIQRAADMTGMKRTTFVEKMRKHDIQRRQFRGVGDGKS